MTLAGACKHAPCKTSIGAIMLLFADMGLPMIMVYLPSIWLMLIPIIVIEAIIGVKVAKLPFKQSVCGTTAGNLFSTILGIPITWLVLAAIELQWFGSARGISSFASKVYAVTIQSPWLIPYEDDLVWMVPTAAVFLAVLFWLASVVSEYFILRLVLRNIPPAALWRWMWTANAASYAFLLFAIFVLLLLGPLADGINNLFRPAANLLIHAAVKLSYILAGA